MHHTTNQEAITKLRELINDIDIAMLTTVDDDGTLRSRPMGTQKAEFDGDLWFLTRVDTAKVDEIQRESQVNVSYAKPDKNRYVSVSGTAVLINDKAKIDEFWDPIYKAFFPEGKDDPRLRLLKVHVQKAEFWTTDNLIATVIGFAKALAGQESDIGENEKLQLN
ncbi:MAG: pyridoxamine 5'-phosphate oxidase family protein [Candidatus Promineofilum sp.]|jgi:general stress protein 26|nr:pyridoxamine 5'-phosphate oxidase family protein [Promineifilum sp.]